VVYYDAWTGMMVPEEWERDRLRKGEQMREYDKTERTIRTMLYTAVIATLIALLISCASPTAAEEYETLSPSGQFALRDGDWGLPTNEQRIFADSRWLEVQECVGLKHTPSRFPVILRKNLGGPLIAYFASGGIYVGGLYHPRTSIEVLGDLEFKQSWKHEMMHLLLDVKTGDPDVKHTRGGLVEYAPGHSQGADWLRCSAW